MKWLPYPKYKASGVEWLGEVPEHWEVVPLKWAVLFQRGHDLPADEREDGSVPLVSSSGVSATHSRAAAKGPGIVTGRYGTIGHFHLVADDYWPLNTTLYSIDLRGNEPRFLTALLDHLSPLFLLNAVKSAVPGVDRNDIHQITTAVPPVPEQRGIAAFIDRETLMLDTLVAKKRTLIERLKEKRIALISRTVTRGLPPDAARAAGLDPQPKLKPSGIDSLGDIPERWHVKKLKYLALDKRGSGIQIGPFGGMLKEVSYDPEGEYKVYGQENTLSGDFTTGERWITREQFIELSNYQVAPSDVLFTRKGSIGGCSVYFI